MNLEGRYNWCQKITRILDSLTKAVLLAKIKLVCDDGGNKENVSVAWIRFDQSRRWNTFCLTIFKIIREKTENIGFLVGV